MTSATITTTGNSAHIGPYITARICVLINCPYIRLLSPTSLTYPNLTLTFLSRRSNQHRSNSKVYVVAEADSDSSPASIPSLRGVGQPTASTHSSGGLPVTQKLTEGEGKEDRIQKGVDRSSITPVMEIVPASGRSGSSSSSINSGGVSGGTGIGGNTTSYHRGNAQGTEDSSHPRLRTHYLLYTLPSLHTSSSDIIRAPS